MKSTYEILMIISSKNEINPFYSVVNKIVPIRKFIMANKVESEDVLKESFSPNTHFFDLILGKGFDKFSETYEDKGMLPLIYIVEWIRIWVNMLNKKLPLTYSSNLLSYIHKASKFKLTNSGLDINLEMCGKENLKIFLALTLYSNTMLSNDEDGLLNKLSGINSLFVKACLSCLNEYHAISLNKPHGFNGKVKIQHHIFWVLHLTTTYRFNDSQSKYEIMSIENPLNMIKTLSNCLLNREFDEYHKQMEQDYLICIYLFYLFHQVRSQIKEKNISKLKVNSVLGKEIDIIIQIASNV